MSDFKEDQKQLKTELAKQIINNELGFIEYQGFKEDFSKLQALVQNYTKTLV